MKAGIKQLLNLLGRKELLSVFVMIFIADLVVGVFSPTFSLYAAGMGASLTFIGLLSSIVGLTRIVASIPIGMLSDAKGRKGVLLMGMLALALSSYLYSMISDPLWLIPVRVLSGLVITSTFFIGMAYVGDMVQRHERGMVSGIYTTCMGLGFTVGSWMGGHLAASAGYVATYRIVAVVALAGAAVAWLGLAGQPRLRQGDAKSVSPLRKLGLLARRPDLLAASLGYMLIILMFDAAIVNFFPLYASELFIGQAAIGSMLAIRALASTSVRLPTGLLSNHFRSERLMVLALLWGMAMVLAIYLFSSPLMLTITLAGEGICFGMYLVSGQTFVTQCFDQTQRGTAMGVYSMTGSIGSLVGPFVLGAVADFWGLRNVFLVTSATTLVGILAFVYMMSRPHANSCEAVD